RAHGRPAPAQRLLGAVEPPAVRPATRSGRRRDARGAGLPRALPGPLREGHRLRRAVHAPDHRARVHRQPSERGAALPARADRRPRPHDALRAAVRMTTLKLEVDAVLDELDAELVALEPVKTR